MKSSIRIVALATSALAISLSMMPVSAAAAVRRAGGTNLPYLQSSTTPSNSSTSTIMRIVAMAVDNFLWFPSGR